MNALTTTSSHFTLGMVMGLFSHFLSGTGTSRARGDLAGEAAGLL